MARQWGVPTYKFLLMPHRIANLTEAELDRRAREIAPEVVKLLLQGQEYPPLRSGRPGGAGTAISRRSGARSSAVTGSGRGGSASSCPTATSSTSTGWTARRRPAPPPCSSFPASRAPPAPPTPPAPFGPPRPRGGGRRPSTFAPAAESRI